MRAEIDQLVAKGESEISIKVYVQDKVFKSEMRLEDMSIAGERLMKYIGDKF
jgi:hypothetical protein